jgi:hypothetical protein
MAKSTLDIILGYTDKLTGGLKKTLTSILTFGKKANAVFTSIGDKFKQALLSPQTLVSAGFLAIGAKITQWALKASGDMEMLQAQLETVMSSTEEAAAALQESINFSVKTPFKPDEIVQTRILLESVGVAGGGAVEAVAEAAGAMNRNITDVATAVMSMEAEPLRRLGIGLTRNAGEFAFTFKNKMGEAVTATASSFEEAQGKVLDIFMEKFDGGVEKMASTWDGLKSTLSGVKDLFFADLGDGFMPQAKQIVQDMINLLNAGIDSGKIKEMGETIGQWIQKVRDDAVEVLKQIRSLDDVQAVLKGVGLWLKDKLVEAGQKAAAVIAEKAPIIGQAIGDAIKESLLSLDQTIQDKRVAKKMLRQGGEEVTGENVDAYVGQMRDFRAAEAGEKLAAQVGGDSTAGKTLKEYINTELEKVAQEAVESLKADSEKILEALEQGLTGQELDNALAGLDQTAEDQELIAEYLEAFGEQSSKTAEASAKTSDAIKSAADAANESNEQVKTVMTKAAEVSTQVLTVAQTTNTQLSQLSAYVSMIASQQSATDAALSNLAGQVNSMRV